MKGTNYVIGLLIAVYNIYYIYLLWFIKTISYTHIAFVCCVFTTHHHSRCYHRVHYYILPDEEHWLFNRWQYKAITINQSMLVTLLMLSRRYYYIWTSFD